MLSPIIDIRDIKLHFNSNTGLVRVLNGVNLEIMPEEAVALVGPSGSGKSSLLMLIGGMEQSTYGNIRILKENISKLGEEALTKFRQTNIGVVFQSFHLIPTMTALDNVKISLEISKIDNALNISKDALEKVGLSDRMSHYPAQLSGGEQQRVALARAIVKQPKIILADEPTGNLDTEAAENIKTLLFQLRDETKATLLIATHSADLAACCDRKVFLKRGMISEDYQNGLEKRSVVE